jgi:predicted  nucleic acid-binding Zn-ribbon protein
LLPIASLQEREAKLKKQELETEAQVSEAAEEYKRLRTEQLREKKQHEQTMQQIHPNDPNAIITDM